MSKKLSRRSFIGLMGAFAALSPVLPIEATPTKKKKITVKLLPDKMMEARNANIMKMHERMLRGENGKADYLGMLSKNFLPHANSPEERYDVFEGGKFIGVLEICYKCPGITEIRDRRSSDLVLFETFFGMGVKSCDRISFSNGTYNMERQAQDEKDIIPIAENMVKMAIEKTEKLIEKYREYKND